MTILFLNKLKKPDDEMLRSALGSTYKYWEEIRNALNEQYGMINPEWKYYGAKSGWTLKMMLKKRNLFFLKPYDNYFRIAFVFGDKAVKAIEESNLPAAVIEEVKSARKYAEGRGLRVEMKKKTQIKHIIKLTSIKVNN